MLIFPNFYPIVHSFNYSSIQILKNKMYHTSFIFMCFYSFSLSLPSINKQIKVLLSADWASPLAAQIQYSKIVYLQMKKKQSKRKEYLKFINVKNLQEDNDSDFDKMRQKIEEFRGLIILIND